MRHPALARAAGIVVLEEPGRAIGAREPDPAIRNPDYLAEQLLGEPSQLDLDHPVIEALVLDVDMSLVRRNLAMTPQERLDQLAEMQRFAAELAAAGRRARQRR